MTDTIMNNQQDTYNNFMKNRLLTIDIHRCDMAFQFPGDDKWYEVLHGDEIQKTYGLRNGKTRGAMSTNTIGLNYREQTTDPNIYTFTIISLNDWYKRQINKVAKHNLNMGVMVKDRYTGKGFTFHFCSVANFVGQTSVGLGRDSLKYTIELMTFEHEDENEIAVEDNLDTEDREKPSQAFPGVDDAWGL
ncbi:MAG: hypothetical protein SOT71_08115 [Romboutsia timonensis]|uniref:hypothetical protein n=1 Tax=Romboutsia timonensis TaxID=1776391 RepID=UPI002A7612E6|nr:hypothetical protein [Romboutsia timonensis]MDY2882603.1 hypothetical protein [Romboutsia timonensis]